MQLDTGASGREGGGHSQGQSLARHAIATSSLIDLYKADPPPPLPFCLIDLGCSRSKTERQDSMQHCFFFIIQ